MSTIERSAGIELPPALAIYAQGKRPGGGYSGATDELDATVQRAAELLADAYGMDVEIRFNSDRESGGAWLKTPARDGKAYGASDVGLNADTVTESGLARTRACAKRWADDGDDFWTEAVERAERDLGKVRVSIYLSRRVIVDDTIAAEWCEGTLHNSYGCAEVPSIEDGLTAIQALTDLSKIDRKDS